MNLSDPPPSPPRSGYFLPEHARYRLAGVIEHLELLAQVVASRNADDERDAWLQCRPDQLAWWFAQLARELAPVIADLEGPGLITVGVPAPLN